MWCSLFVSQKWWTSSWCFIRSDFHSHYFTCCKVNFPWFLRAYFLWVYIPVSGYLVICKSLWLYINIYSCQLVFFSIFVWYAEGCRRICLCLGWLRSISRVSKWPRMEVLSFYWCLFLDGRDFVTSGLGLLRLSSCEIRPGSTVICTVVYLSVFLMVGVVFCRLCRIIALVTNTGSFLLEVGFHKYIGWGIKLRVCQEQFLVLNCQSFKVVIIIDL